MLAILERIAMISLMTNDEVAISDSLAAMLEDVRYELRSSGKGCCKGCGELTLPDDLDGAGLCYGGSTKLGCHYELA